MRGFSFNPDQELTPREEEAQRKLPEWNKG
jgi:hypothetical protein